MLQPLGGLDIYEMKGRIIDAYIRLSHPTNILSTSTKEMSYPDRSSRH